MVMFFFKSLFRLWKKTRGCVHKIHLYLSRELELYSRWHEHRHHKKVHWAVFGAHAATLAIALVMFFMTLFGYKAFAAGKAYSVTNREEWEAGTNVNLDTEDTPGDAKIMANGSWTARTWKTPPDSLTLGVAFATQGGNIYTMRGNGDRAFWKYSTTQNTWTGLADAPYGAYYGSHIVAGDSDTLYAIFGNYIKKFYKYTISTNTWTVLADAPDTTGPGSSLAYNGTKVFLLRSSGTQDFWAYDIGSNSWDPLSGPPATVNTGSDLTYDGSDNLYTLRGAGTNTFYRFTISTGTWTTMTTNFPTTINAVTKTVYTGGAVYVPLETNTTTFYKCVISGTTCSGGTWTTLTALPAASQYAGVTFNDADGYLYVFRGNSTYDLWKYDIGANSFVGPTAYPQAITTGGDLIWDGANTVYSLKGGAPASGFYAYSISANTWTAKSVTNLPTLSYDTKAVKAGNFIYLFTGNSTAFWAYDTTNDAGGWVAKTVAPAAIGNGGSLAYPGSGDRIYALRGAGTNVFYSYSIANNNWTTFDPTDLPASMSANVGARLTSDGTNIFAVLGTGNTNFYRYNVGSNNWTNLGRTPFTPYYGTDLTYNNGNIYALAGYYSNKLYEYSVSGGTWRKLPNFQTQYLYDTGPYNGASLEYYGSNGLMVTRGANYQDVLSYTIGTNKYLASATYQSSSFDLTNVSSWTSLTTSADTPGNSSVIVETQTSANGSSWSSWQAISGTTIQSPVNRYIRVKATLNATSDFSQTPALHSYSINYEPDTTPPGLPGNFVCKSQEVGGQDINSGQTYLYMHPFCTWDTATDNSGGSGISGYWVYFGPNASADPVTNGNFQTDASYVVNKEMTAGNNYLIVKAKDNAGNDSATSITGFTYNYNGVSPYQSVNKTSTDDFNGGALDHLSSAGDKLKLSGRSGFWKEGRLAVAPASIGYGSDVVYKPSVNKLYVTRGQNTTTFWEYDIATDTWTAKSSVGLGTLYYGGGIVNGPGNYIYAMRGGTFNTFYRYDITNDAAGWVDANAEDAPTAFGYGGELIYDGSRYIYALKGNSDDAFYRFDPQTTADGQWSSLANVNFGYPDQTPNNLVGDGGSIAYDGNGSIYAIQGSLYPGGFSKYNITTNYWTPQTPLPMSPGAGAFLTWDSVTSKLFYIAGNISPKMFSYDPATSEWAAVSPAPSTFSYGAAVAPVNGTFYVLRGNGTQNFYKYNTAKNYWYTPAFNIFGPDWYGTSNFTVSSGSAIVKGDSNNFYALRGSYDNKFVKYDPSSGTATTLANIPSGTLNGAALAYDSTNKYIYATVGTVEKVLFKYDINANTWSADPDAMPGSGAPGAGASMVYDGSRYIFYARGAGTTEWYKYDTQAAPGSKWSAALPTAGFGTLNSGSKMVYNGGNIYVLRGGGTTTFYKFNGSSWSTLNPITAPTPFVTADGFLIDGNDGNLYASPGGNMAGWYQFNLASGNWGTVTNFPAQVTAGGAGDSNMLNKIFAFSGAGTNSWADGLYAYVVQTADSSFEETGSYTSQSIDLTKVYNWTNLKVNYTIPSNTTLFVDTQSSPDNSNWSSWAAVTQEKITGTTHEYAISSPEARYIKVRFTVTSGDGVLSPTINDYQVNYYKDTDAPSNPTALASAKSKVSDGADITNDNWYNHIAPYFTLPASGAANGAVDNSGGSGVAGYYVYFGTDADAVPSTAGTYQTGLGYTGSVSQNNETYYLRVQTKDNAGNVQGTPWTAFTYKYDSALPTNPTQLTANPLSYTSNDNFTFTISDDAADAESGRQKYQYRTGGDNESTWYDFNPGLSTSVTIPNGSHPQGKYRDGVNQFYLRTVDGAGNVSTPINTPYYFGAQAPTPPQNLQVNPSSNTTNSFSFTWDAPATYVGDVSKIKYYYSVNALPTQYNTNETPTRAAGPSAFATQKGENIFYVIAKDEANNVDYGSYASVPFTANTSAPSSPTYTDVSDISDKEAQQFRLVISWMAPDIDDPANFGGYDIYSSTEEDGTYTKIANTTGTAYVHTNLVKDSKHYYYIVSADKTGNQSAPSSKANATATGRYTRAPKVTKSPEATPKAKSASIGWVTEREANSSIEYGTTKNLGQSTGNKSTQFETDHKVALGNLEPGTTYYYKAVFVDPDGNIGQTSIESFITSPAPIVSNLKIEDVGTTSLTVNWESNVPAHGDLFYGKTSSFGGSVKEDDYPLKKHSVKLSNLESDMEYHFQVRELDEEDNIFASDEYKMKTLPLPQVSGVKVQGKTGVDTPTLDVEYGTNVDATTIVRFGPEGGKIKEYVALDYKKIHELELTDLLPTKQYTIEITGRDRFGNDAASQKHQVMTLSDTMPPKVLSIVEKKKVLGEGSSAEAQLTLKVKTNESSTMIIEASKGTSGTDFNIMSNEDPLNTDHTVVLKLGDPGAPYSYRVKLKDTSGNQLITEVKTFVVARGNKSALDYIVGVFSRSFSWLGKFMQ